MNRLNARLEVCKKILESGADVDLEYLKKHLSYLPGRMCDTVNNALDAGYLAYAYREHGKSLYALTYAGEVYAKTGLTIKKQRYLDDKRLVLSYFHEHGELDSNSLSGLVDFDIEKIRRMLCEMEKDEFIFCSGKKGYLKVYEITEQGVLFAGFRPRQMDEMNRLFYQITTPRYPKYLTYHWTLEHCEQELRKELKEMRKAA